MGYLSTAFVAGRHRGRFSERDLDLGQSFRNSYERSKFEAELLVRSAMTDVPITVIRPSIVMGHSRTGETTAFNVLYIPMRLFATGQVRRVPALARLPLDIVPVDFVSRVTREAVTSGIGQARTTYPAVAGRRALTAGELAAIASDVFALPPPSFIRWPLPMRTLPPVLRW